MKVVVVGAGKVGTFIAGDLARGGHQIVVVERDAARVEQQRSREGFEDVTWVVADACEVSELTRAHPEQADVLAAVTGDDEDNLVVSLLAKQEFGVPRVLARVNHPANDWLFDDLWGVDVAVSTPQLLSALVEEAVSIGSLVRLFQLAGGSVRLAEMTLPPDSPLQGTTIADARLPRGASVVAIIRGGGVVVPRDDTVLHRNDEVLVLVTAEVEDEVTKLLLGG